MPTRNLKILTKQRERIVAGISISERKNIAVIFVDCYNIWKFYQAYFSVLQEKLETSFIISGEAAEWLVGS